MNPMFVFLFYRDLYRIAGRSALEAWADFAGPFFYALHPEFFPNGHNPSSDWPEKGARAASVRQISETDVLYFARASRDNNGAHVDPKFAARTRFKKCISHGLLVASTISALLAEFAREGEYAVYEEQSLFFKKEVPVGSWIATEIEVIESNPGIRQLKFNCEIRNLSDEIVLHGTAVVRMMRLKAEGSEAS